MAGRHPINACDHALHNVTPPLSIPWHVVFLRFYYFPIIFAAVEFGWRGGLLTAILSGLVCFAPHALVWSHDPDYADYNQYGELIVFCVVAVVAGVLSDRERRHRVELEESVARIEAAHADQATNVESLKRADRLALVGTLAGGFAQEMQYPLQTIERELERLDKEPEGDRAAFEMLKNEVRRWNLLLTDLLRYVKGSATQLAEAPLNQVVDSVLEAAERDAQRKGVAIRRTELQGSSSSRVALAAEGSSLHQVLLRLILHAIESSDSGTTVEVRLEIDNRNVNIEIKPGGSHVEASRGAHLEEWDDVETRIALMVARHVVNGYGGELRSRTVAGDSGFCLSVPLHQQSSVT